MDFCADFHPRTDNLCQVALMFDGFILVRNGNDLSRMVVIFPDVGNFTVNLGNNRNTLRSSCFKQFLNSGKTLSDITVLVRNTAGMEVTHCQLSTRFTDSLSSHDTDCFAFFDEVAGCHVSAIALTADTRCGFTGEYVADICFLNACSHALSCQIIRDVLISVNDDFTGLRILNRMLSITADDTVIELLDHGVVLLVNDIRYTVSLVRSAVVFIDDDFLGNVNETSCQISGFSCLKRCIRQTLTYAVR